MDCVQDYRYPWSLTDLGALAQLFRHIERAARGEKPLWIIPELRGEPSTSVFHSLQVPQAKCGPLLAIHDFCGHFDDFRVEGRGTERCKALKGRDKRPLSVLS